MTYGIGPVNSQAAFLPIEFDIPYDANRARELITLRERLTASVVNVKEIGQYELSEIVTAQQWFSTSKPPAPYRSRYSYRKVFDMVALTGAPISSGATVVIPHNVRGLTLMTRMFGDATTSTGNFLPLPYASSIAINNIEIFANQSNLTLINGSGQPALIQCYVVMEYLKQ